MGVPSYFAWLVRHTPEILSDQYRSGHIDHLYLDLNCAIHPAVKERPMTLEEMPEAVWQYIVNIVTQTKPQKLLYIAIDGVAPVAKMKQQRLRRYKTILDQELKSKLQRKYSITEASNSHDFNMISPGTEFMRQLNLYLRHKLDHCDFGVQIIFSDSDTAGEGEHKIMQHIASLKDKHNIVIYGLDSDLIFLALRHYRAGIALFRERQFFEQPSQKLPENSQKGNSVKEFSYLSIDLLLNALVQIMDPHKNITQLNLRNYYSDQIMRDYQTKFTKQKQCKYRDLPRQIALDYIYLCFFLGNDFLPALPALKIKEGGLDQVILAYKLTQADRAKFLIDSPKIPNKAHLIKQPTDTMDALKPSTGIVDSLKPSTVPVDSLSAMDSPDLGFLQTFVRYLASIEESILQQQLNSQRKRLIQLRKQAKPKTYDEELAQSELLELAENYQQLDTNNPEWRKRYYQIAFNLSDKCHFPPDLTRISQQYICGMQWTWSYYQLSQSTSLWVYPFEHGPLLNDLSIYLDSLTSLDMPKETKVFDTPLTQLLQILPPQSATLLPDHLSRLMTDPESGLAHIYPTNVVLDTNFKQYRWQAHPILPPINRELVHRIVERTMADAQI